MRNAEISMRRETTGTGFGSSSVSRMVSEDRERMLAIRGGTTPVQFEVLDTASAIAAIRQGLTYEGRRMRVERYEVQQQQVNPQGGTVNTVHRSSLWVC